MASINLDPSTMAESSSDPSGPTFFVPSSCQDPSYDPPRHRNRHRLGRRLSRGRGSVSSQTVHSDMGFCIQSIIGLLQTRGQFIFTNHPINITAALIALCIYSVAPAAETVLQREPPRSTHMAISCRVILISWALATIALASTFLPSPLISCVTMFVVWAFVVVVTTWPFIRSLKQRLFGGTRDPSYDPPRRSNRHRRGRRRSRGRGTVSSQTVHSDMGFCIQSIIGLLQTRGQFIFTNHPINITAALIALCIYSVAPAAEIVLQREPPRRTHMAICRRVSLISGALATIALASTVLPSPMISCVTMFIVWAFVVAVTTWPLIRSLKQRLFCRTRDAVVLV